VVETNDSRGVRQAGVSPRPGTTRKFCKVNCKQRHLDFSRDLQQFSGVNSVDVISGKREKGPLTDFFKIDCFQKVLRENRFRVCKESISAYDFLTWCAREIFLLWHWAGDLHLF
jgi:hypothetical protein